MPVEVKRARSRVYERLDWLHAWHCLTGPAYGLIHPGLAQRMTAGAGILHSERNDSWVLDGPRHERDVEMVQMWVARGRRRDPDPEPVRHPVGRATAARGVRATARRAVGVHLYVPRGSVDVEGVGRLSTGDAARCTDEPGRRVTAREASEVLVWEMLTSL